MTEKLREIFDEMTVYKDLKNSNFFNSLSLPSFLRDWLLRKFEDDDGQFDIGEVSEFVNTYLPNPEAWTTIKSRIINDHERVKFLTRIIVDIDIKTAEIAFSLPAFGLTSKETISSRIADTLPHSGTESPQSPCPHRNREPFSP